MLYHFPHPGNRHIRFTYNDENPMILRKTGDGQSEHITLIRGNINAADFFFYLIKCKTLHIENRSRGFVYQEDSRIEISKPYDCKSAVHKLLEITTDNPLIVNDRRQSCYLWPYTDDEMSQPIVGISPFGTGRHFFSSAPGPRENTWEIEILEPHGIGLPVSSIPQNQVDGFERKAEAEFESHRTQAQAEFRQGFGEFMNRHESIRKETQGKIRGNMQGKNQEKKQS